MSSHGAALSAHGGRSKGRREAAYSGKFNGPLVESLARRMSYSGAAAFLVVAFGWVCVGMAYLLMRSLADFSIHHYGHISFVVAITFCGLTSSLMCLISHGAGSKGGQGAWSPDLRFLNKSFWGLELRDDIPIEEAKQLSDTLAAMPVRAARRTVIWGALVIATTTLGEAAVSGTAANSPAVLFAGVISITMLVGFAYLITELYSADGRTRLKEWCFYKGLPIDEPVLMSLSRKLGLFAIILLVSLSSLGAVTLHGSREWEVLFGCVVFSLLAGGMLITLTAWSILRSFKEIVVAADDLAAGGAGQIFSSSLDREVVELAGYLSQNAREINATREHLEEMVDDQTEELRLAVKEAWDASLAKGRFLATMSHEIRTPMNAILGMTGLLLDSEMEEDQREFAESIQTSGETLLALINDVLDFSRLEVGKVALERVEFDVRDIVDGVVEMLAERAQSKGLELVSFVSDDVQRCMWGDPSRLLQVLVNLVGNAIKFTQEGEVVIRATVPEEAPSSIQISVRDTGIGIAKEFQSTVFEAFTQADGTMTRSYGGTGLGLAIAKDVVELMDGEIGVESELGEGARFFVTLPVEPGQSNLDKRWEEPNLEGLRFLLVEDNQSTSDALGYYLSSWGATIFHAGTREEAREQTLEQGGGIDFALVDAHMVNENAAQWREALRVGESSPHVVMMFNMSHRLRGNPDRDSQKLKKPISRSALARVFSELVES